jgi:hypothetical protein
MRSRHSRRMVPTNRSATALARGAWTGVLMILWVPRTTSVEIDLLEQAAAHRDIGLDAARLCTSFAMTSLPSLPPCVSPTQR